GLLMRSRLLFSFLLPPLATTAVACASRVSDDPGTNATMRVPGARFVRGAMPLGSPSAPGVASIVLVNSIIVPDAVGYPISGALDPSATAAAIGLKGDVGYWVVVAGLPNVAMPADPSFATTVTFSSGIAGG